MFPTTGLFGEIPCPKLDQCQHLNCIFNHDHVRLPVFDSSSRIAPLQGASLVDKAVGPPHKKRRLDGTDPTKHENKSVIASEKTHAFSKPAPLTDKYKGHTISNGKSTVLSSREISPPPLQRNQKAEPVSISNPPSTEYAATKRPRAVTVKESLNPRTLSKPPAPHAIRLTILKMLHEVMVKLNSEVAKDQENYKRALVLQPDELVTMALDEEERAAKDNPSVYSNVIKLRIVQLKRMKDEDWKANVLEKFTRKYFPETSNSKKTGIEIKTGLTKEEEIAMLPNLLTPLKGLEKFGYVTTAPTEHEIDQAREGVQAAEGYEKCDRCGTRFQAFPGRREDGALTSGGSCTYHSGKPIYNGRHPTYSCCNQSIGESTGCTQAECHVFKVSEVKRLASILQFESTPSNSEAKASSPISFDCEMGYTTLGLELIRLTATAWPGGEEVLDVLVRPMGEVLDLNSKYSGVFPKHFLNAKSYHSNTSQKPTSDEDHDNLEKSLALVDSPAAARSLLFSFLQPETPLIGHAIDNDLNVCRIIHPTIIDTVLLYPHPKGLPIRFGLKVLTKKYLERNIQMGGDRGHDSKEDAVATGDLVKVKVASKWDQMRRQGWTVRDNAFYPPLPLELLPNKRRVVLGPGGARPKRPEASVKEDDTE